MLRWEKQVQAKVDTYGREVRRSRIDNIVSDTLVESWGNRMCLEHVSNVRPDLVQPE